MHDVGKVKFIHSFIHSILNMDERALEELKEQTFVTDGQSNLTKSAMKEREWL